MKGISKYSTTEEYGFDFNEYKVEMWAETMYFEKKWVGRERVEGFRWEVALHDDNSGRKVSSAYGWESSLEGAARAARKACRSPEELVASFFE